MSLGVVRRRRALLPVVHLSLDAEQLVGRIAGRPIADLVDLFGIQRLPTVVPEGDALQLLDDFTIDGDYNKVMTPQIDEEE